MLLRFGVANHRSIRDYQELLLTASKRRPKERVTTPIDVLDEQAVPVAALYGANASGKSNILEAMAEMQRLIVMSHKGADATDAIERHPFRLDDESPEKPTQFDCTFTLGSSDSEEAYEYGFEFTDAEIVREWLHRTVRRTRVSTHRLFERETSGGEVQVDVGPQLRGEVKATERVTRPNSLFLSAAAQNNHPQLTPIHEWFAQRWFCVRSAVPMAAYEAALALSGFAHADRLRDLLVQADAGIEGFAVDEEAAKAQVPVSSRTSRLRGVLTSAQGAGGLVKPSSLDRARERVRELLAARRSPLTFEHSVATGSRQLDYDYESRGTQMLLSLLVPALDSLATGDLLIIDELDSSLHPNLAQAFLSLFEAADSNPNGAQLIFSTHDVALLGSGLLAHDEIWITEKNREGISTFTPLTDYRIRSRVDVEMAYRNGRFGGIPNIHDFLLEVAHS